MSIHALREEGDLAAAVNSRLMSIFLSTPSVRRATAHHNPAGLQRENFYPRPPRGGRRLRKGCGINGLHISIHALREEGDL